MRWALFLLACSGCLGSGAPHGPSYDELACSTDDDCAPGCEQIAADLRAPGAVPPAVTSSDCGAGGMGGTAAQPPASGVGCFCNGGAWAVGSWTSGCAIAGRTEDCLYEAGDFPGCTIGDDSCGAVCDDIRARLVADAARIHDAAVHGAVCDAGVACRCVIALDGICRAWNPAGAPYDADCSRSARDILAAAGLLSRP